MITTRIQVKEHLREYVIGKYNDGKEEPVHFPDKLDIYHLIFDLTEKRPIKCQIDKGNLEVILPVRRIGKDPATFNYLGIRSQKIIEDKLEIMFWSEAHEYLDSQKHQHSVQYIDAIHIFMKKYGISSISEDALAKNYYRWRKAVRKKEKTRQYTKKQK